jgi:hypothetical protein
MRLSVDKSDPGYSINAYNHEAYLDGVKVNHCVTADEELGEVTLHIYVDGHPKLNLNRDKVLTEIKKGKVEIRNVFQYSNIDSVLSKFFKNPNEIHVYIVSSYNVKLTVIKSMKKKLLKNKHINFYVQDCTVKISGAKGYFKLLLYEGVESIRGIRYDAYYVDKSCNMSLHDLNYLRSRIRR